MESDLENLGERIAQLERLVNEEGGVDLLQIWNLTSRTWGRGSPSWRGW